MTGQNFSFTGSTGSNIYGTKYCVTSPRGIIQIVHGMAEHRFRYHNFASYLNKMGYSVYSYDHLGHGETAVKNNQPLGFFTGEDGWENIIQDMYKLSLYIIEENQGLPLFIFAHSMGSFIAREYITRYGDILEGVIFSGTAEIDPFKLTLLKPLVKLEKMLWGSKNKSKLIHKIIFSSNNRKFKPQRTDYDWLSRDRQVVDNYIMDRLCGFTCTTGFYDDFIQGLIELSKSKSYSFVPDSLSLLFITGGNDPIGGEDIKNIAKKYRQAGVWDVNCKIYPGARHELINETNKREIISDLAVWLNERTGNLN